MVLMFFLMIDVIFGDDMEFDVSLEFGIEGSIKCCEVFFFVFFMILGRLDGLFCIYCIMIGIFEVDVKFNYFFLRLDCCWLINYDVVKLVDNFLLV